MQAAVWVLSSWLGQRSRTLYTYCTSRSYSTRTDCLPPRYLLLLIWALRHDHFVHFLSYLSQHDSTNFWLILTSFSARGKYCACPIPQPWDHHHWLLPRARQATAGLHQASRIYKRKRAAPHKHCLCMLLLPSSEPRGSKQTSAYPKFVSAVGGVVISFFFLSCLDTILSFPEDQTKGEISSLYHYVLHWGKCCISMFSLTTAKYLFLCFSLPCVFTFIVICTAIHYTYIYTHTRTGNKDIDFLMNSISVPNAALPFSYLLSASAFCFQKLTHLIFLTS